MGSEVSDPCIAPDGKNPRATPEIDEEENWSFHAFCTKTFSLRAQILIDGSSSTNHGDDTPTNVFLVRKLDSPVEDVQGLGLIGGMHKGTNSD